MSIEKPDYRADWALYCEVKYHDARPPFCDKKTWDNFIKTMEFYEEFYND